MDKRQKERDLVSNSNVENNVIEIESVFHYAIKELKRKIEMQKCRNAQTQKELSAQICETEKLEDGFPKSEKHGHEMLQCCEKIRENRKVLKQAELTLSKHCEELTKATFEEESNISKKINDLKTRLMRHRQDHQERLTLYHKNRFYPQYEALKQEMGYMQEHAKAQESEMKQRQAYYFKTKCEMCRNTRERTKFYPLKHFILKFVQTKCDTTKCRQEDSSLSKEVASIKSSLKAQERQMANQMSIISEECVSQTTRKTSEQANEQMTAVNEECFPKVPAETGQDAQQKPHNTSERETSNATPVPEITSRKYSSYSKWTIPTISIKIPKLTSCGVSKTKPLKYQMIKPFSGNTTTTSPRPWSDRLKMVTLPRISVNLNRSAGKPNSKTEAESKAPERYAGEQTSKTFARNNLVSISPLSQEKDEPSATNIGTPLQIPRMPTCSSGIKQASTVFQKPLLVSPFFQKDCDALPQTSNEMPKPGSTEKMNMHMDLNKNSEVSIEPITEVLVDEPSGNDADLLPDLQTSVDTAIEAPSFEQEKLRDSNVQKTNETTTSCTTATVNSTKEMYLEANVASLQISSGHRPNDESLDAMHNNISKDERIEMPNMEHGKFTSYLLKDAVLRVEKMPECDSPTQYHTPGMFPEEATPRDASIIGSQENAAGSQTTIRSKSQESKISSPLDFEKHIERMKHMMESPEYQFQYTTRPMFEPRGGENPTEYEEASAAPQSMMIQSIMDFIGTGKKTAEPATTSEVNTRAASTLKESFNYSLPDSPPERIDGTEKPMFSFGASTSQVTNPARSMFDVFGTADEEQGPSDFTLNFGGTSKESSKTSGSGFRLMF